jgi:hypothetical protein
VCAYFEFINAGYAYPICHAMLSDIG